MSITEFKTNTKLTFLATLIVLLLSSCDTTEPDSTSLTLSLKTESDLLKISDEDFQIQEVKILSSC